MHQLGYENIEEPALPLGQVALGLHLEQVTDDGMGLTVGHQASTVAR